MRGGGDTDERPTTTSATPRASPSPVHASAQHGAPTASATPRAYPSLTLDLTSAAASWSATGGDREGSFRGSMNAKSSFSRGAVVGSKDGAPRAAGDGGGGRGDGMGSVLSAAGLVDVDALPWTARTAAAAAAAAVHSSSESPNESPNASFTIPK